MRKNKKKGRPIHQAKAIDKLKNLGVFKVADAVKLGIPQQTFSRYVANHQIEKVDQRLYMHPDSKLTGVERDFAIACTKFGNDSAIGLNTALFYYGLTEVVPKSIWVLVNKKQNRKYPKYRCVFTTTTNKIGVEDHHTHRITNLERTLVESLKFSKRIGLSTVLRAIRQSIKDKRTTLPKMYSMAKTLGLQKYLERHWESLVPESEAT